MLTGDVWGITLIVVALVATIAAAQVFLGAVFPRRLARTRAAVTDRAWLSGLIGLPVAAISAIVIAGSAKVWGFGAALASSGALVVALVGLAAVAAEVGARLPSPGAAAQPWRTLLRGSILLSLASLLPVAGWFLVFPVSVLVGVGAFTRSLFARAAVPVAEAAPARVTEPALEESVA